MTSDGPAGKKNTSFCGLKIVYYVFFHSHLRYIIQLWEKTQNKTGLRKMAFINATYSN